MTLRKTAALLPLLICCPVATANDSWLRLVSPHFDLVTGAGENIGREALIRLERMRSVLGQTPNGHTSPLPLRVFLFANETQFRPFRPTATAKGFYQGGPERDSIVLFNTGSEETWRILQHEFVHATLHHSTTLLPQWLEEGTAEFYSTLDIKGERVRIGRPVASHVRLLAQEKWIDAAAFESAGKNSPYLNEANRAGVFYAQSWALAHMLNLAPAFRESMPRYSTLLEQSIPAALAFEQAFGKTFAQALAGLAKYIEKQRLATAEIYRDAETAPEITVAPLAEEDVQIELAQLFIQVGRAAQAESTLLQAARTNPKSADIQTALALCALERKDNREALRRLGRAMDLGSRQAVTYFEYAMILRETGGNPAEIRKYIEEAAGRNANFAEAHFLLGLSAQQEGRHRDAIVALEQAVRVLPRQSYFWHALSLSYHELGDRDGASRAARNAAGAASTDEQLSMAQAALRLAQTDRQTTAPAKLSVSVPESWKPKSGDVRIEGTLEQLDCGQSPAHFHVRADGRTLILSAGNAVANSEVTLACGPQKSLPVVVQYQSTPGAAVELQGVITSIEFR